MTHLEKKESHILSKIQGEINNLNYDLTDMDNTDNIDVAYAEEQDALETIGSILKNDTKLDKLEDKSAAKDEKEFDKWVDNEEKILKRIKNELVNLNKQLKTLTGDSNKMKRYFAQKKALLDIKKILHEASEFFKL
ncbi:hypothetical protein [Enterococcus sp. DIV0660C]|uniref:hypothetical protein n=1 Tax=Enterococcus sp. DIV0660C TaxID=2230880 RepID=UPI001A9047FB|nr:hypothetical protein [Enterococcus sp. DIV0660C]MBO0432920.1 hypothetical protein [Enterococcus sp. DIV0660C]